MRTFARVLVVSVVAALLAPLAWAASENAKRDANRVPVQMGVTGDAAKELRMFRVDPNTGQLLVSFSRTWPGAGPEVYVVNTVTVTGAVDSTLVHVPFSQTMHGRVTTTPDSQTGIIGEVGAALVSTIPGSRTNSVLASEELDNASYWGLANVTIQADATVGPDGIASADWVRETNANDYHTVQQLLTLLDDKPKAISFYAKKKERSVVFAMFYENAKSYPTALQFFDIDAGTLGSTDQSFPGLRIRGAKIVPSSVSGEPGWWRCMMIVERLAGVTGYSIEFGIAETDGVPTYAGTTGYGAYITRAQVEDDEVTVGPYIKTTTVAVTEGSDLLGDVKATEVALNIGASNLTLGKKHDTQAAVDAWTPGFMAVRRDDPAGGAPSANNDWFLLQGDALGRLWTHLDAIDFSQTTHGAVQSQLAGAGLVTWTATTDGQGHIGPHVFPSGILLSASTYAVSVTNAAAVNLFPEALPGATSLMIQNLGTKAVYLGDVNVTATTGIQIGNGGVFTLDFTNEALVWYAIGTIATAQDLRIGRW